MMLPREAAPQAPELAVSQWFNTNTDITLESLRGNVVMIETFQMLCPGCVSHGIPQAQRVQRTFRNDDLVVLGLHTVFEHHDAMTPVSLEAFLHEYKISFPVGVDAHEPDVPAPITMRRYQLMGTPSLVLIDRSGKVRTSAFGQYDDIALGADIARLLSEPADSDTTSTSNATRAAGELDEQPAEEACTPDGCVAPVGT